MWCHKLGLLLARATSMPLNQVGETFHIKTTLKKNSNSFYSRVSFYLHRIHIRPDAFQTTANTDTSKAQIQSIGYWIAHPLTIYLNKLKLVSTQRWFVKQIKEIC